MAPLAASEEEQRFEFQRPDKIVLRMDKPTASSSPIVVMTDPLLDRVVQKFSACVTEAAKARGAQAVDQARANQYARALIDASDRGRCSDEYESCAGTFGL
jgi:hypothetical protein